MKKVATVVLAFGLLMVMFAVVPVVAASPKKIDVTATLSGTVVTPGYEVDDNHGEIRHVRGMEWNGKVVLNIPGRDPLEGTFEAIIDGMRFMNPAGGVDRSKVGDGVFHFREVWTFDGGTFEGTSQVTTYASGWTNFEGRIVLQGTDEFAGWTMWMEDAVPPAPVYYGQLLIP